MLIYFETVKVMNDGRDIFVNSGKGNQFECFNRYCNYFFSKYELHKFELN